ncbi:MAG: iron-containing alcohol dehydrogenase [candidate division WOR-3 bacterium]
MSSAKFEFATADWIIFGVNSAKRIADNALTLGNKPLIVTGENQNRCKFLLDDFTKKNIKLEIFSVNGEPTTKVVTECLNLAKRIKTDVIIGIGGGSAIDTGKAVSALITNGGELLDYLEVIGRGKPITKATIPFIAVPTTAGTGTEVTKNAVIKSNEHSVKVSLRSPFMLPDIAILDPVLTYSMPKKVTASTGLDAFTQVMEPYVSIKANMLTDAICKEGLKRISRSLLKAFNNPADAKAREDMCIGSLFGGIALANAKLGAVHGFAGPMGGMIDVPHGVVCGILLPYVIKANIKALQERKPNSVVFKKYEKVAKIVTKKEKAKPKDLILWTDELYEKLNMPHLSEVDLKEEQIEELIGKAKISNSMKGNPIVLTDEELKGIIKDAF